MEHPYKIDNREIKSENVEKNLPEVPTCKETKLHSNVKIPILKTHHPPQAFLRVTAKKADLAALNVTRSFKHQIA